MGTNFNLGALRQWQPVQGGHVYSFPVGTAGYREVSLDLLADE